MKQGSVGLRLFLDTADRTQWQIWLATGIFYGVTTNPLLLERSQILCTLEHLQELAHRAFELGAQEVQLQTWGTTIADLVETAQRLAAIDPRVVVKVPITQLGVTAAAQMIAAGIPTTLTGVYAIPQILIAAALNADYAAPYLGRISDSGRNGRDDVIAMQQAIVGVKSSTRVLVASIRHVDDLAILATQGVDTFTIAPAIAAALFHVAATNQAAIEFERAARAQSGVEGCA